MTLQDCLDILAANPVLLLFYFIAIPLTAILAGELDRGEGYRSPWKYLYSILIYLVSIPGLFAVVLSIYLFVFRGQSILNMDLATHFLPIASMAFTLWIIRKNVDLDLIPGFDRLSGLLIVIFTLLLLFWILDKMRIVAFTRFPFFWLVLLFVGLVGLVIYGIRRFRR